jgi:hypothetical protein
MYRAAQNPASWLLSAERLRDAAEIILTHERAQEVPYFRAHKAAVQQALAIACTGTNAAGTVEIACAAPNYPPAQVLYAYAIENVLKGLIVAGDATIVDENRIGKRLKSHDLIGLSAAAGVQGLRYVVRRALREIGFADFPGEQGCESVCEHSCIIHADHPRTRRKFVESP